MKKAYVACLIILLAAVSYFGYGMYRESQMIDVVVVKVKHANGNGFFMADVALTRLDNKPVTSVWALTNQEGVAVFHAIPPGVYEIRMPNEKECTEPFIVRLQGVNATIEFYVNTDGSCGKTLTVTPKK